MIINFNGFNNEEEADIQKVFLTAKQELKLADNLQVNLVMIEPQIIREMNYKYRLVDRVTDVLSFPMVDDFNNLQNEADAVFGLVDIGDIYICKQKAMEQAEEYNHSLKRELCFLAIHGLLHLLGYDHIEKKDEEVMFPLQDKILNKADIRRE